MESVILALFTPFIDPQVRLSKWVKRKIEQTEIIFANIVFTLDFLMLWQFSASFLVQRSILKVAPVSWPCYVHVGVKARYAVMKEVPQISFH